MKLGFPNEPNQKGCDSTTGQAIRWGLLSLFSFLLNLGITVLLTETVGLPPSASFGVALAVVLVANFLALRYFVFRIRHQPMARQAKWFGLLTIGFRVTEWAVFSVIHTLVDTDYRILVILVLLASSASKFFTYRSVLSR